MNGLTRFPLSRFESPGFETPGFETPGFDVVVELSSSVGIPGAQTRGF